MYFFLNKIGKKIKFKHRKPNRRLYKAKNFNFFFKNKSLIELNILKRFFTFFKRLYKKKTIYLVINLKPNHILTKKPKNARMGKGKGKFLRFVYRVPKYTPVLQFFNCSSKRVHNLKKNFF